MSTQAKPIDSRVASSTSNQDVVGDPDSKPDKSSDAKSGKVAPALVSVVAANDASKADSSNNLIKRTVDEICGLMASVHEIREELLAQGVKFHMLNALIELGVQDKQEELVKMVATAVESSVKPHGQRALDCAELLTHLEFIVTKEKDLRHVRHLARQQGVHMQALNHLTKLIRQNPGDNGVQAVNTFVAYADAAGVPLDRFEQIRSQFKEDAKSVLPDISRDELADKHDAWMQTGSNVLLGLVLTGVVMWMVL